MTLWCRLYDCDFLLFSFFTYHLLTYC